MRKLGDLPPAAAGTTGYLCPVDDCDWYHYEPPVAPPQSVDDVAAILNEHADPSSASLQDAVSSAAGNVLLGRARETEMVLRAHFATHPVEDWLRTINRLRELAEREPVTEYGQIMPAGGYHVRNPSPRIEGMYPVADWIADERKQGRFVARRRVVLMEDWIEVTEP